MAAILKWKQPDSVTEWEWKQAKEQMKRLRITWIKWWIPLASLCLCIIYRLEPDKAAVGRVGLILLAGTVLLPLWFCLTFWFAVKEGARYEICKNGLIKRAGNSSEFHKWRNIEYYRTIDHPDVDNVKAVEFKVAKSKKTRKWGFDPAEVDESELRRLLEEHLSGKSWDSVGDE